MRFLVTAGAGLAFGFFGICGTVWAENRSYGNVTLQGLTIQGANRNSATTGMVCNVNGPDGYLSIRSGPGTNHAIKRKLNRLAILSISPSGKSGKWVPVTTAFRTHSKEGYSIGGKKSLHVSGWAHGNYICDYTAIDPFFSSNPTSSAPSQTVIIAPPATPPVVLVPNQQADPVTASNTAEIAKLQGELDVLTEELNLLKQVRENQQARMTKQEADAGKPEVAGSPFAKSKVQAIDKRIDEILAASKKVQARSEKTFLTPIRPTNASSRVTARKLAELFPKVPFYLDSTTEVGEMRIRPYVSDLGEQLFELEFVDITSKSEERIEEFDMTTEEVQVLSRALEKSYAWSGTAKEKQVRDFRKTVDCITQNECDVRLDKKTSTQLDFRAYSDGSTGAVLVRNKGARFSSQYSFSIESALLLSAYADFIWDKAMKEFDAETRTGEEIDSLFK